MERKRFALERAPLFTAIFGDDSLAKLVRQARAANWAGADAVCVELKNLPREERTPGQLRGLMDATPLPTMCCLYRSDILDGADRGVCGLNGLFSCWSQFLIHGPSYAFSYAGLPGMRYC